MWLVVLLFLILAGDGLEAQIPPPSNSISPVVPLQPAAPSQPTPTVEHPELGPAFLHACGVGDMNQAVLLLGEGAPLEWHDNLNRTPLFVACFAHPDIVKFLLAHGARVDPLAKNGDSTISIACEYNQLPTAEMLLDAGADANHANQFGRTPLMLAALRGHDLVVSMLVSKQVDVNFHGMSEPALFYAVAQDHLSTAKLLLDADADPGVGTAQFIDPKKNACHLLIWAAATNDLAMVDLLLAHGIDINSADIDGITTLIKSAQGTSPAMIAHLLEKGAIPNLPEDDGRTPLMCAVNYQQEPVLQNLLDRGAKLEIQDKKGRTALIWACYYVYDPSIRFLVDHGADVNAADLNGETPLTYAGDRGDTEMVKFLQDKGATRTDVHIIAKPDPQPPLAPDHSWALAVGAIYAQTNGNNPHVLGYDNSETVEEMRKNLKDDWGITDRASFLKVVDDLRNVGQRSEFQMDGILYTGFSDFDFTQKTLLMDAEKQVEAKTVRTSYLKWREKSGLAWDLCRAANLINFGLTAHYIEEQEAWPLLMDNARQVQGSFNSWQEMSDNFLDGREIWATGVETKFEACSQLLCNPKDPNSPWNQLPWKTDLTAN